MNSENEIGDVLYFNLLHAIHQLLTIVNNVKLKLDEFFRPSSKQLSPEQRTEFIKALISHLAFTTNKMINTVPDLNSISQKEEVKLLCDFLVQEANYLHGIVYTFVESAQKKQDINEYLNQQNKMKEISSELDEFLSHMEQTVILLEKQKSEHRDQMNEFLGNINSVIQLIDELINVVLEAQNSEHTLSSIEKLKHSSTNIFEKIVISLKENMEKKNNNNNQSKDYEQPLVEIQKEMETIITFVLDEVDVIAKNLTHDPIYSEQQASNISTQVRSSFFLVLCDIQQKLIGYKLVMQVKKQEVLNLELRSTRKTTSLPHLEFSTVPDTEDQNRQNNNQGLDGSSTPKTPKRKNLFNYMRKRKNSITKVKRGESESSTLTHSTKDLIPPHHSNSPKALQPTKSNSLPITDIYTKNEQSEEDSDNTADFPKAFQNDDDGKEKPKSPSIIFDHETSREEKMEEKEKIQPIPNIKPRNRLSTTFSNDTIIQSEENISKRPKISRMVSKSKILNMEHKEVDAPERKLTKEILDILQEEFPWFKENYHHEHDTAVYRVNSRVEEIIKRDLVRYGNKVRGPVLSITRSSKPSNSEALKAKDLNQFVSTEVLNSESWKGLFTSTKTLLTPLEIPRVRIIIL